MKKIYSILRTSTTNVYYIKVENNLIIAEENFSMGYSPTKLIIYNCFDVVRDNSWLVNLDKISVLGGLEANGFESVEPSPFILEHFEKNYK